MARNHQVEAGRGMFVRHVVAHALISSVVLSAVLVNGLTFAAEKQSDVSRDEPVTRTDAAEARRILGPLAEPDVQDELKLSQSQIVDLMRVALKIADIDKRTREELHSIRGVTAEERKREVADAAEERITGLEGVIQVILNNDQKKMLNEILLQRRLRELAENPKAGSELRLSEDQRVQLSEAWRETADKLAELRGGNLSGGDRAAAEKQAMKEFTEKASGILSEEQRLKLSERKDRKERPFDVSVAGFGDQSNRSEPSRSRSEQRNRKSGSSRASSSSPRPTVTGPGAFSPLQGPLTNGGAGIGAGLAGSAGATPPGPSELGNASTPEKGPMPDGTTPAGPGGAETPKPAETPTTPETPEAPGAPTPTPTPTPTPPGADGAPTAPKDLPPTPDLPKPPPPKPNF